MQSKTSWHNVAVFRPYLQEKVENYVRKGFVLFSVLISYILVGKGACQFHGIHAVYFVSCIQHFEHRGAPTMITKVPLSLEINVLWILAHTFFVGHTENDIVHYVNFLQYELFLSVANTCSHDGS